MTHCFIAVSQCDREKARRALPFTPGFFNMAEVLANGQTQFLFSIAGHGQHDLAPQFDLEFFALA